MEHDRPTIIAYTGETERYRRLDQVALDEARGSGSRLILYDADAASRLAPPLPTWWSGDGSQELFEDRLNPDQLDAAGRPVLAQSVRDAMVAGVDAWGWLPTARGANELASYARQQHAALLVLPADLNDLHWLDRLKGESGPGEVQAKTDLPILTVELSAAETGG